jgi:hypothetical protein
MLRKYMRMVRKDNTDNKKAHSEMNGTGFNFTKKATAYL